MSRVTIVPAAAELENSVERALTYLGNRTVAPGDTVLLKPNLVEPADPESGQITTPRLIEAVARYCLDAGAKKVIIGEGPGYYQPESYLRRCFTNTGVAAVAERLGIDWVLFDEHPYRTFRGIPGCIARDFHVTEYAFNCDKFINLPVLKTHWLTRVTLGMKNLKGCLKWEDKPLFHRLDLERAVIELNKIVRPSLTIIDGTPASLTKPRGSGTSNEKTGTKGLLLAGTDIVATDTVGTALLGIDPTSVNLLNYGAAAGLGENDLARIDVIGELKRLEFRPPLPEEVLRDGFPGLTICGASRACCGCLIPLLAILTSFKEKGVKSNRPCRIYIGRKPEDAGENDLTIGDCAWDGNSQINHVKGCPPDKIEIRQAISTLFEESD